MITRTWVKPSRSAGEDSPSVEVRRHDGGVEVRESSDPTQSTLSVATDAWRAFIAAAKRGEFDL